MLLLGRGRRLKLKKFPLGGAGLHIGEAVYIYVDAGRTRGICARFDRIALNFMD